MNSKLRECFDAMTVYKDSKKSNFFSTISLPSFLRDWVLHRFEDEEGHFDIEEVSAFVSVYIPRAEDWIGIKNRVIMEGEHVKILARVSVDIDVKDQGITFALPDYGLGYKDTLIDPSVWDKYKNELIAGRDVWGVVELGYRPPDDAMKLKGKVKLISFANFCPYTADVGYYKDVRSEFDIDEWIDLLLGAVDYNAAGFENQTQKLTMLTRLLPFVEKRLNLVELAPKGTGKSYLFGNVSRYGTLVDGGKVTRAKMFYDKSKRAPGYITGNDYVAIDEVKLVSFDDVNQMRSVFQGYMENGKFNVDGYEGKSDAGVVFLGNIMQDRMNEYVNMFEELPELFKESALLDRIHGFIKGWDVPRTNDDLKVCGWALNSEYFSCIMHELRSDLSYRAVVDELIMEPERSDTRDTEAVKRIATAYLKLLFPNVRNPQDIGAREFKNYCLRPAVKMRGIILNQLSILDKEYQGKDVPHFEVRQYNGENL